MKKCYIIIAFLCAGLYSFAETTLMTPVLVAPAANAINQMPNVLLNWDPVSGNIGLQYEIQVDTSSTFLNPILLQTELSSTRPSGLLFATKYYWHVRAVDNSGTSDWSEVRSFTVLTTVTLASPTNNATKVMPNAEISWVSVTGVNFFDYQLDTLSTFDSPLSSITSVSGTLTKTNLSNLYFNTKYFRRMRARHENDTSAWSASRVFTTRKIITITTPPSPDSLSINQDVEVQFKWAAITGITKYVVMVADNPDFILASTMETTKTTINSDTLDFGVTYYWKVEAVHPVDMVSSPLRSFTTRDFVELVAPINNQTGVDLTPTFSWEPIKGCVRYDLALSDVESFENAKIYKVDNTNPTSGPQKFQLPAYIIDSAGYYFWKVRAMVPGDTSAWSNTWTFRVAAEGIGDILPGKAAMSVYPNPAKDKILVSLRSTERATLGLSISNLLGNILISENVQFANGKSLSEINVNSLPKGVYFVKLQKDSSVFMTKLIIDR